jgi:hypothetical protein
MGKVTGFIEFKRDKQPYRAVGERVQDWRHSLLPSGVPARQPDPGLERPRLPGPVA